MNIPAEYVDAFSLTAILAAALLAPLAVGLLPRPWVPEVVVMLVLGMLIGPYGIGVASESNAILLLSNLGLGFVFFMAGYELDLRLLTGRIGFKARTAWLISMIVACVAATVLYRLDVIDSALPVAIVLTSTALGTLLPILRDRGMLETKMGRLVMANGAIGELGPILAISLFLGSRSAWASAITLMLFGGIGYLLIRVLTWARSGGRLPGLVNAGAESTAQTPVRAIMVLVAAMLALADIFGLDLVLGGFVGGIVVRRVLGGQRPEKLESKLDGVAFGFLVPVFFVVSGMNIDVLAVLEQPAALIVAFLLILTIRSVPVWFMFADGVSGRERIQLALYCGTGLPIIVAVTTVAVAANQMTMTDASVLVTAGVLTVLVLPTAAGLLDRGRGAEERLV